MKNRNLWLILAGTLSIFGFTRNAFTQPPEPPNQAQPTPAPKLAVWTFMTPIEAPKDCQIDYEAILQTPPPLAPDNHITYYQVSLKITLPGDIAGIEFIAPSALVCRSSVITWAINLNDHYFTHPDLGLLSYINSPNNEPKGLWFENRITLVGKDPKNGKIVFQKR